ncbi:hypothetical protein H0H92_010887 [Tricholoma furcatifolium]|nr:hypothetical protein H0H92_010887 [Tricholoma furcatifolium]
MNGEQITYDEAPYHFLGAGVIAVEKTPGPEEQESGRKAAIDDAVEEQDNDAVDESRSDEDHISDIADKMTADQINQSPSREDFIDPLLYDESYTSSTRSQTEVTISNISTAVPAVPSSQATIVTAPALSVSSALTSSPASLISTPTPLPRARLSTSIEVDPAPFRSVFSTPTQSSPAPPVSTPTQSLPAPPISTPTQSSPAPPVSTPTPLPLTSITASLENSAFNFPPSSILGRQSENSLPLPFALSPSFLTPANPTPDSLHSQPPVPPIIPSIVEAPIGNTHINFHIPGAQISENLVVYPPVQTTPDLTPAQKAAETRKMNKARALALQTERQDEAERNAGKPRDRSAGFNPDGTQKARPRVNARGKADAASSAPAKRGATSVSARAEKRSKK